MEQKHPVPAASSPSRSHRSSFKSSSLSVEIPAEPVDDAVDSGGGPLTELRVGLLA